MKKTFEFIDASAEKYLDFLCRICSFEARAYDKATIDQMVDYIEDFAQKEGFETQRTPMEKCGDFLTVEINRGAEKAGLLMAHMDTVFDKGVFGSPAVRREGDKIFGPGVIDCKGGIAIALLTMKALKEQGFEKHLRLTLTSDEEISNILGGAKEQEFFKERSKGFPCAINCETSEQNQVVVGRKAILKFKLDVKGASGHAGKNVFTAKNAVVEAAHKIVALSQKSEPDGTTYSCNIVQGGSVLNIIPDHCAVTIDVRARTVAAMERAKETVAQVANTAFIAGTSCEVTPLGVRPPMEKTPETMALLQGLLDACEKYDLGTLTAVESGGGSDSCYTQLAGVPSICSMGAVGAKQHTPEEYVEIKSISLRAKILSAYFKG